MKRRPLLTPLLFAIWLFVVALACNLTSDNRPPTVVPRATNTPPPTIGYATLPPDELPPQVTSVPQQQDTTLLNLINQVATDRLSMHVTNLQNFYTRHYNSTQSDPTRGIGAAQQYILDQFEQIRANAPTFIAFPPQTFPVQFGETTTVGANIIGYVQGTEPERGVIVIGAHYDSISADFEDGNAFAPGANDNASGVAALIEIANIMSQRPHRASVMFVAFGAEEIQRVGSIAFVKDYLQLNNIDVEYMINMDIIGSSTGANGEFNDSEIRVFSAEPNNSPSRILARNLDFFAFTYVPNMSIRLEGSADRESRYSDHISFNEAEIAAVRFIEAVENPNLQHTDRDRWESMRPAYLTRATQTILASVTALADGPRPPQNIQLRTQENGLRTLVWDTTPDAVSYMVLLRAPGSLGFSQSFPVSTNSSGEWDKFTPQFWEGVAVASVDASGLMGPISFEYGINN